MKLVLRNRAKNSSSEIVLCDKKKMDEEKQLFIPSGAKSDVWKYVKLFANDPNKYFCYSEPPL